MPEFESVFAYADFERSVKAEARYVHREKARKFLRVVLETSQSKRRKLSKDRVLFRAQRGFHWTEREEGSKIRSAHHPPRMTPTAEHSTDGRINVRGIPCQYLASHARTALAEVRPWVESYVSLAKFKMMRDCTVVDCSSDEKQETWSIDPDRANAKTREAVAWGDIAYAFSKPVAIDEPHLDYIPTQVLAETFRNHGYDSIIYNSLLDEGGKASRCSISKPPT